MTLPTKAKTWEFPSGFQNLNLSGASDDAANQDAVLQLKNALTAGDLTRPWVVKGSSDSAAAGMDGVDRWSALADIVADTPGNAHSWIVLEQPGIQPSGWTNPLQVLLTMNGGSFGSHYNRRSIVLSLGAGFGAANGGSDGSTTADPTATDQWGAFWQATHLSGAGAQTSMSIHVMVSDDGEVTRIIYGDHGGTPYCRGWLSFEMIQNPTEGWSFPFAAVMFGGDSATVDHSEWEQESVGDDLGIRIVDNHPNEPGDDAGGRTDPAGFVQHARAILSSLYARGSDELIVRTSGQDPHAVGGAYILDRANLISRGEGNPGYQGLLGSFYDLYATGANATAGDMMPSTGEKTWAILGELVVPWLDDSSTDISL